MKKRKQVPGTKVQLIASEEARPQLKLTPGKRYEIVVTSIVDTELRPTRPPRPPRLCGSRSTCVAIVELE